MKFRSSVDIQGSHAPGIRPNRDEPPFPSFPEEAALPWLRHNVTASLEEDPMQEGKQ